MSDWVFGFSLERLNRIDFIAVSYKHAIPVHLIAVKQEFFLLTEDGREVPIQLSGVDIPVRDGQTVTMIAGGVRPDGRDNYWVRMAVHDTGRDYSGDEDGRLRH